MDPKLLNLIVCPLTKGNLVYSANTNELFSYSAKVAYPIKDGIPILLAEEARNLTEQELENRIS